MAKKRSKKTAKKRTTKPKSSAMTQREKLLIENFVSLQKVLVHVSEKFDNLSYQISELLKLFDESAKVIVKNELEKDKEEKEGDKLYSMLNSVLEQNKLIAKGLTLMYEHQNENSGNEFKMPNSGVVREEGMRPASSKPLHPGRK